MRPGIRDDCPICGSTDLNRSGVPCPWGELLRCLNCEHVMASRFSQRFFDNRSRQLQSFGKGFTNREAWLGGVYDQINARRTAKILALSRHARIIEIGPGRGAVMAYLSAQGHEVRGLDISKSVGDVVRKRYGLTVEVEDLTTFSLRESGSWDAAVMRHVLEHFEDPVAALKSASKLLRAGGRLYVAVPNMDSWHRNWSGWSGYEPYHLHFFGRTSLLRALKNASFQVRRFGSYESPSGWTNTLARSYGNRRASARTNPDDADDRPQGMVRGALELTRMGVGLLTTPFRFAQAASGLGEELFALAIKAAA